MLLLAFCLLLVAVDAAVAAANAVAVDVAFAAAAAAVVVVFVVVVVLAVLAFVVESLLPYILRMGSFCYPDASVSTILFSPFPIFRFTRAIADAHLYPPPSQWGSEGMGAGRPNTSEMQRC